MVADLLWQRIYYSKLQSVLLLSQSSLMPSEVVLGLAEDNGALFV